jgi:hypothetical protein
LVIVEETVVAQDGDVLKSETFKLLNKTSHGVEASFKSVLLSNRIKKIEVGSTQPAE